MAVTLRMARYGQKKRPFYRIVATEKNARRDGRYIEIVGNYNPMVEPPLVSLKEDRVRYWIENGAQTSGSVRDIIKAHVAGLIEKKEEHQQEKIKERRKKRKERLAKLKK